ncbi:TetR/AcrR family transcriptional regulator [Auraticoccus monumenti]|uniref:DNA-binding transcriptional regulator, AcrR family n=1 Tax=Auraticoccus monumenti TaxID=675864 RepID=A0A1G6TTG5_9ACTN|nr:TetR/AcrR family transcriptional regulator [Auraticoccus monumenti]SDD32370.1 DNA-binding transcriptional regulator, AcrR family [Auraticoccus monumenti]
MPERSKEPDTRDKILIAAATMLGEDPTARLSVRAVAARAGVSTGSLRHFFPTQRALVETVVAGLYELDIPDDPISEEGRTPAERLLGCLQQMLAQIGTGDRARQYWRGMYEAYVAPSPTDDEAATYLALERVGLRRLERWLGVLVAEGAAPAGAVEQRARFLGTVLDGLVAGRVLPGDTVRLGFESDTLRLAVEAVLSEPAGGPQRDQ